MTQRKNLHHPSIDAKRTLLTVSVAHIGSTAFRSLYMKQGHQSIDICRGGELSCAFFVSAVLRNVNLIAEQHATVSGTVRDLQSSGWRKMKRPRAGAVIVWGPIRYPSGESHAHIGIAVSTTHAISTSVKTRTPIRHRINTRAHGKTKRSIESIWWHRALEG